MFLFFIVKMNKFSIYLHKQALKFNDVHVFCAQFRLSCWHHHSDALVVTMRVGLLKHRLKRRGKVGYLLHWHRADVINVYTLTRNSAFGIIPLKPPLESTSVKRIMRLFMTCSWQMYRSWSVVSLRTSLQTPRTSSTYKASEKSCCYGSDLFINFRLNKKMTWYLDLCQFILRRLMMKIKCTRKA